SPGEPTAYLMSYLGYQGDDCLSWPHGRDSRGYGICRVDGVLSKASRHMCILTYGPPPFEGAHAAHSCGNGHLGCFNPRHLRWATCIENSRDKYAHGTMMQGERVPVSKLTNEQALAIYNDPRPVSKIAADFGTKTGNVWMIKTGKTWRHITGHDPKAPKK